MNFSLKMAISNIRLFFSQHSKSVDLNRRQRSERRLENEEQFRLTIMNFFGGVDTMVVGKPRENIKKKKREKAKSYYECWANWPVHAR